MYRVCSGVKWELEVKISSVMLISRMLCTLGQTCEWGEESGGGGVEASHLICVPHVRATSLSHVSQLSLTF